MLACCSTSGGVHLIRLRAERIIYGTFFWILIFEDESLLKKISQMLKSKRWCFGRLLKPKGLVEGLMSLARLGCECGDGSEIRAIGAAG